GGMQEAEPAAAPVPAAAPASPPPAPAEPPAPAPAPAAQIPVPQAERQPVPTLPPAPEHWPNRTDTREFQVIRVDETEPTAPENGIPGSDPEPPAPESLFAQPALPELGGDEPREFAWGD